MGNASRIFLSLCPQCFAWQLQKEVPATEVSVGGWLAASCKQSTRSQRTRAPEIAGKAERSQQLAATEARGESCVSAASVENAQDFAGAAERPQAKQKAHQAVAEEEAEKRHRVEAQQPAPPEARGESWVSPSPVENRPEMAAEAERRQAKQDERVDCYKTQLRKTPEVRSAQMQTFYGRTSPEAMVAQKVKEEECGKEAGDGQRVLRRSFRDGVVGTGGEGDSQSEVKKTSALPVSADSVLATLCFQQQLLQQVQQQRVLAQEAARAELRQMQQETLVEIKAAEAARIERLFEERKTHAAREKREFEESRTQSAQRASQEKMEEWPARSRSPSCGQQDPMTSFWRQRPQSRADAVPYAEPEWMRANREAGQRRQATAGGRGCPPGLQTSGNQSKTRKKRASAIRQNKTPRVESRAHLQQAYKTNQQRRSHAEIHEANQRRSWQDDESSES